jgi:RNA polymerase sigma factor (sigma-70 family)
MLVRDDDADDLVQEALRIALEQDVPPSAPRRWLHQVLRNLVRGRARRTQLRRQHLPTLVQPEPAESPEAPLYRARAVDAIERALAELDEPYRSTVFRRFFEDLTPLQIARADGDPPATVRWRVHEGLRRIRASLDARLGGRDKWCGGFAIALAIPGDAATVSVPATSGGATVPTTTLVKILAVIVAIALVVVALGSSLGAQLGETTDTSLAPDDLPKDTAAAIDADGARSSLPMPEQGGPTPADPAEMETLEAEPVKDDDAAICDALVSCLRDLPSDELAGLPRLEIEVHTWTLADGGALIERVDLTTGRKLMFDDDVDADTPIDAPGVVVHDELATCIGYTIDTDRLPTWHDGMGRIAVNTTHTHPFREIVPLDDRGHVVDSVGPCSDEADPEPVRLVDVSDESTPTPEDAVAALDLPTHGARSHAAVRIVECGSYTCPFCKKSEATLAEVGRRFPGLSVAWLHFPLTQDAAVLAIAATAAHRQGRFWEMHRALFEHAKPVDRDALLRLGGELGLDADRFEADLDDPSIDREVARQHQVCTVAGARATPTFFINGDFVAGERGVDGLIEIIDETLDDE